MWQSAEVEEKSSIIYLHVIPAFTDRKDAILLALNKLESIFIKQNNYLILLFLAISKFISCCVK